MMAQQQRLCPEELEQVGHVINTSEATYTDPYISNNYVTLELKMLIILTLFYE